MKKTILLMLLLWNMNAVAQQGSVVIPSNALDKTFRPSKVMCEKLEESKTAGKELSRSRVENIASNGVVVKWMESRNKQYSQKRYNHMLLKLYSDSFMSCPLFREYYHLIFDYDSSLMPALATQHQSFVKLLHTYITKDAKKNKSKLNDLMKSNVSAFGTIKKIQKQEYKFSIYKYSPSSGPSYPLESTNLLAEYKFDMKSDKLELLDERVKETRVSKVLKAAKKSKTPPPPQPPGKGK